MVNTKLELTPEGAAALREFSGSMPLAVNNIVEATTALLQVYQSVAEGLGVHGQDFYNMLLHIKKAQENASEALEILPPMLNKVADSIDTYVASKRSINS